MQTSDVGTDEARPFLFSIHIASSLRLIVSRLVARGLLRASAWPARRASPGGFVQLVFIGLKPGNIFIAISHPAEAGGN